MAAYQNSCRVRHPWAGHFLMSCSNPLASWLGCWSESIPLLFSFLAQSHFLWQLPFFRFQSQISVFLNSSSVTAVILGCLTDFLPVYFCSKDIRLCYKLIFHHHEFRHFRHSCRLNWNNQPLLGLTDWETHYKQTTDTSNIKAENNP